MWSASRQALHFRQLFALMRRHGLRRGGRAWCTWPSARCSTRSGRPLSTRARQHDLPGEPARRGARRAPARWWSRPAPSCPTPRRTRSPRRSASARWSTTTCTRTQAQHHARLGPHAGDRGQQRALHPVYVRALPLDPAQWAEGAAPRPRDPALLTHPAELALIKQLARLPEAVREAGARYAPFVIAEWCYETARDDSASSTRLPGAQGRDAELRAARLRLVAATAQALRNGLAPAGHPRARAHVTLIEGVRGSTLPRTPPR